LVREHWGRELIGVTLYAIIALTGVHGIMTGAPVSQGIDQKTGTINVYELCPEVGDSIMVVNCGTHFEIRHHHWTVPPLALTDDDIEDLKAGRVIWH
jgi:hypothetical protein